MPIYHAWKYLPRDVGQLQDGHSSSPHVYLNPDRLLQLRKLVIRQPLAPVPRIMQVGEAVCERDRRRDELNAESKQKKNAGKGKNANPVVSDDSATKLRAAQDRLNQIYDDGGGTSHSASSLLGSSPLAGVRIGNSTSSKLNYILNEVCRRRSRSCGHSRSDPCSPGSDVRQLV